MALVHRAAGLPQKVGPVAADRDSGHLRNAMANDRRKDVAGVAAKAAVAGEVGLADRAEVVRVADEAAGRGMAAWILTH